MELRDLLAGVSLSQIKDLMETATLATVLVDDAGRIVWCNAGMEALCGYQRDEITGHPLDSLFADEFQPEETPSFHLTDSAAQSVKELAYLPLACRDGAEIPVDLSWSSVNGDDDRELVIAFVQESSGRARRASELAANRSQFRMLFDEAPVGIAVTDLTVTPRRWLEVNDALCRILGFSREELLALGPEAILHPEDRDHPQVSQVMSGGLRQLHVERRCVHKDGHDVWLQSNSLVLEDDTGTPHLAVSYLLDLSERKRMELALESSEAEFRTAFDEAPNGMAMFSLLPTTTGRFLGVNEAYCDLVGYSAEQLLEMNVREVTHPDDIVVDDGWLNAALSGTPGPIHIEKRLHHADGHTVWVRISVSIVRDADGRLLHTINQVEDITARKAAEEHLEHQALHDLVTGLPNRALLMDRLYHELSQLGRGQGYLAVLFLDLDRFKSVNDTFGHAVGDRFLFEVSRRMSDAVRPPDTVARIGGDEFVVLCANVQSQSDAEAIASRVIDTVATPLHLDNHEMFVSASIGIALTRDAHQDPHQLLRRADAAMLSAKEHGRSRYEVYTDAFRSDALERFQLETDLRHAVDAGQLRLLYQPVIDVMTGRTVGVEALVRFMHPTRGMLMPDEFIPLAEESGLIVEIGNWTIAEACRQQARTQSDAHKGIDVAVNLSARQLEDAQLAQTITDALRDSGADPEHLVLEVTETAYMGAIRSVQNMLDRLSRLGIRLAIDDFGTGYSSLVYLKRFPVHAVKIDRSFVAGIGKNADDTAIVAAVLSLSHSLGLTAVAEGVETIAQMEWLRGQGCDEAQGFHISHPLDADALAAFLARP